MKVDGATDDVFGVGGYRLAVDYLSLGSVAAPLQPAPPRPRRAHERPARAGHPPEPGARSSPDARFDYTYRGVIEDASDVDTYQIHATGRPGPGTLTLNVMVWGSTGGLDPRIAVFDAARHPGRLPGAGERHRDHEHPGPERLGDDRLLSCR